jgi:hypothetical protein
MVRTCGRKAWAVFTTYEPFGYVFPATVKSSVARKTSHPFLRSALTNFVALMKSVWPAVMI